MHLRAKAAGMYEYGASPEQMHYVPHVPPGAPAITPTLTLPLPLPLPLPLSLALPLPLTLTQTQILTLTRRAGHREQLAAGVASHQGALRGRARVRGSG